MNCNDSKTKKQSITDTNKGIWIPREILEMELTLAQKITLALINQLSEGKQQAAWITNAQIAEITGIKEITIKNKVKPTLRKKGLISTVGICNTMHLKGDTNTTEDKHLKGDTNGEQQNHDTNAMHLKGDTNETYLKGDTGNEDKHLKGDEDSTQKVIQNTKENITKLIITKPILIKRDDTSANNTVVIDEVEDIPEWMLEIHNEPFEQYTDDVQATDTFHTEDEKPTDTATDKVNNNIDSFGDIIADALQTDETEETNLIQYEDVLPSDLSNPNNPFLGAPVDYLKADGTITHTDPESLSNGLKTASFDLSTDKTETDTTDNNKNNTQIPMELTLTERKAKQTEITRKWHNFIQQVPTMDRETADKYLNNFIVAANKYFTGEYIERITTQWREQFEFTAKPPFDIEQAKRIVENAVNNYAEQNTIARTLYSIFCKPVNRQWLETTIAEAKQKRETDKSRYNSYGDLPF